MPTDHIVALLIAERDKLNKAIEALSGNVAMKRRGRPPKKEMASATEPAGEAPAFAEQPKTRSWSPEQKAAAALRMKKRWAAKNKAEKEKPRGA